MKFLLIFSLTTMLFFSCENEMRSSTLNPINWKKRSIELNNLETMFLGSSYLSVYSEIFSQSDQRVHSLTVTVSIKNISSVDSTFILKADYFNTEGHLIKTYFDKPIFLKPLETIEIVISEKDTEGGTGGNFVFEWASKNAKTEPHFEGVMISTYGQQGLSFTTQGIKR